MILSLPPLILASRSPRRKELLARLTENFQAIESPFDEDSLKGFGLPPEELVLALAEGKARAVQKLPQISDEAIVIGGDTVVVSPEGEIFGIPKSEQEARSMLESLSGRVHEVITGVALIRAEQCRRFKVSTQVEFYPLSAEEINWYLATGEPFDKAGAYGIQGKGALLVKEIQGDYFNVVGLPLARLARELSNFCGKSLNS